MQSKCLKFALAAAFAVLMTGCASSPEQDLDKALSEMPPAKDPHEAAQRIVQFAAGFCKAMAEKHGADFAACFKQQTDIAIKNIQAQIANKEASAKAIQE